VTRAVSFVFRFEILFLQGEQLLPLFSRDCSILWMGLYGMDSQTNDSIEKFKLEVRKSFSPNSKMFDVPIMTSFVSVSGFFYLNLI